MRLLCVFSVLAIIGSQYLGGKVSKNVDVFWIPPEVETYIPVTTENIEKVAFKVVHIKNKKQADEVIGLIQKSSQAVNTKRIRVKISADGKSLNFDSSGVGVSSAGETVRIDLKRLKEVLCE